MATHACDTTGPDITGHPYRLVCEQTISHATIPSLARDLLAEFPDATLTVGPERRDGHRVLTLAKPVAADTHTEAVTLAALFARNYDGFLDTSGWRLHRGGELVACDRKAITPTAPSR